MTKRALLLTMLATVSLTLMIDAQGRRNGRSTSVDGKRAITNCGDLRVMFDRRAAVTEETEMVLLPSQVSTLQAHMADSGIYVSGWDRNEYSVKTCKAVPDDDPNPSGTFREITTNNANGRLSVTGPSGRKWMANLIIMVPRLANLDLRAQNGPLHVRDLAGNIQLNAMNGPIGLDNVGGFVQATTTNGPISVNGAMGDHRLNATNGPIHVGLSGSRWDGPGLEASTQNGPLSVSIPNAYSSGIRIQASEHSPVSCKAPACAGATKSLSSPSVIRIGDGDPVVRLSTVNGPLSVQAARE